MEEQYETYVERNGELRKGQYGHSSKIATGHLLSYIAKYESALRSLFVPYGEIQ